MIGEDAAGASVVRGARGCGGEAVVEADAAASGGISLDVSAGGPAPLEAPARIWDVLLDAGCSSEEPVGAITLYTQRERDRDCHVVEYGMGVVFCPI